MAYFNYVTPEGESMGRNYYHRIARFTSFNSSGLPTLRENATSILQDCIAALSLPRVSDLALYNNVADYGASTFGLIDGYNMPGIALSLFGRNVGIYPNQLPQQQDRPVYMPTLSGPRLSVDAYNGNRIFDTNPINFGLNIKRVYTIPLTSTSFTNPTNDSAPFIIGDLRAGEALVPLNGLTYMVQRRVGSGGSAYYARDMYIVMFRRRADDKLVFRYLRRGPITSGHTPFEGLFVPQTLSVAIIPDRADPEYIVPIT